MNIAFTICSNNYLAQAITLGQSINQYNLNAKFYIGLIDELPLEFKIPDFIHVIPLSQLLEVEKILDLAKSYNIVELNTSVKPSYFKYLLKINENIERIYYIDPDIEFYGPLNLLNSYLDEHSILLTPHFFSPIPLDGKIPGENIATNYGMYNLGFLGLNPSFPEVFDMLEWWEERCLKNCYIDVCNGIFVDQLVMNHVPLFFEKVNISKNKGLNMGPWNLHERVLTRELDNTFLINSETALLFYHFSSYDVSNPDKISKWYNRHNLKDNSLLERLYKRYSEKVISNGHNEFSKIKCVYVKKSKIGLGKRIIYKLKQTFLHK
jgi:hypothetical protein